MWSWKAAPRVGAWRAQGPGHAPRRPGGHTAAGRGGGAMTEKTRRKPWLADVLEGLAHRVTEWTGGSWAFGVALATIVVWGVTGPLFGFSDTWQLVINTGTT